jgi:hypothetical protein
MRWLLKFFFFAMIALISLLYLQNWRHQDGMTTALALGAFAATFRLSAGMALALFCDIRDHFSTRYSWRPRRNAPR